MQISKQNALHDQEFARTAQHQKSDCSARRTRLPSCAIFQLPPPLRPQLDSISHGIVRLLKSAFPMILMSMIRAKHTNYVLLTSSKKKAGSIEVETEDARTKTYAECKCLHLSFNGYLMINHILNDGLVWTVHFVSLSCWLLT